MRNTTESTPRPKRPVSVHRWKWMIAAALVILGLTWFAEPSRGDDGDVGTVPIPTSTSEPTPVPTVTPTSRPPKPPTNTPAPAPTDTPSAPTNTPAPGETPTDTPAPTDTPTATPTEVSTEELTPTPEPQFSLDLIMSAPPLALQGDEVVIRFMVQNPGPEEAVNVVLRDRLPGGLTLVSAEAEGGQVTTTQEGDGTVVRINWAGVAPGGVLNATLTVQVAEDLPNGIVIDNLAVVYGDNAKADTDGLSIGLPPAILPLFR